MQHSIQRAVPCTGIGIHSGDPVRLTFNPAPAGHGIEFVRTDLPNKDRIRVTPGNFSGEDRGTKLIQGTAMVQTVEHVLSAIHGLGINNIIIEVDSSEMPILDGSAKELASLLRSAGLTEQPGVVPDLVIKRPVVLQGTQNGSLLALPSDDLRISVIVDFPKPVGVQVYTSKTPGIEAIFNDVANARTFGWMRELEFLWNHGLGRGASMSNAIGITEEGYSTPLRYTDEIVRHKVMDLIGDLSGLQKNIRAHIIGFKTSHKLNIQFMKKLAELE